MGENNKEDYLKKTKSHSTVDLPVDVELTEKIDKDIALRKQVEKYDEEIILRVENLKMHYPITKGLLKKQIGSVKAVDGVSFTVKQGQTLGIVGESGSGKSTIGNCVMHNVEITDGKMIFRGEDVSHIKGEKLDEYRKVMTMVTQDPFASLDPRMRIRDSILEGVRVNK
nr:ATP-binding cassette domain-containing protein [Eubacterium sp.]